MTEQALIWRASAKSRTPVGAELVKFALKRFVPLALSLYFGATQSSIPHRWVASAR